MFECHGETKQKADLKLSGYSDIAAIRKDRKTWEKVLRNVHSSEMPPENKPQPSMEEREIITSWIQNTMFPVDCNRPDPGRVTIRRLNRAEYNNTIRDLVGVDFQPAADFPVDDSGYGFDNIGDVLSLSPVLMEKYLAAAEKIMETAIDLSPSTNGRVRRVEAERLPAPPVGGGAGDFMALNREGEIATKVSLRRSGRYTLRARAYGQQAGPEPPRMEMRIDGKPVKLHDVNAVERRPRVYNVELDLEKGEHRLAAAYVNNYVNNNDPDPKKRGDRNLFIDYFELVGPVGEVELSESHERIFIRQAAHEADTDAARVIIENFARRAYRRPLAGEELDRLVEFFQHWAGEVKSFPEAVRMTLQAVLVSPHFLFRGELQAQPDNVAAVYPVDEYALASRLSYFLWSTMPDDTLFKEAKAGTLRTNLTKQVTRMLADPKAEALVSHFAGQWLQTRSLASVAPGNRAYPGFDESLREAMREETERFFRHIMREDRSVLEFINGKYTFVNARLARHYGLSGVEGDEFRKVSLEGTPRQGVLTHASVLTVTSNPTRTSPVKRGLYVLENILGTPPPPPPPNVPVLREDRQARRSASLRQRMEQHRADPLCSSCHARMDPIGFGLENFDGIGAWRDKEGTFDVDPAGKLASGEAFAGPEELTALLVTTKREEYLRCLAEKMLTYALGRGMEYYDKCALDGIVAALERDNYRFSAWVMAVINSPPFQLRRGEEQQNTQLGQAGHAP